MKMAKTLPVASESRIHASNATRLRFTALSISSTHMNITRGLRRISSPVAPMAKIIAASTRYHVSVSTSSTWPRRPGSAQPGCAERNTPMTMRQRVLHGLGWLVAGRGIAQTIRWVATIYVIRLLAPEDYGIVAIATVLFGLLIRLCDAGFGNAVVVSEDTDKRTLQEFFGFLLIISIGTLLLWLLPGTKAEGKELLLRPASCGKCNYVFSERKSAKKPSKCPKCRSQWIISPGYLIRPRR